ncbi:MAG: LysM peptidoglycan-binding domain-containing protein [Clostridia bacterium]|nr:LysM peptidoglycan-binding domain-containing protein [Clostridia bacterium]
MQSFTYTVVRGDTLFSIAQRFNTTVDAIRALNGITGDIIGVGQALVIMGNGFFNYAVIRGDTLFSLANRFGTTVDAIRSLNRITGDIIEIGQLLVLPGTNFRNYTVVRGDTLFNIAQRYGTTVAIIRALNGITGDIIEIGQLLVLPRTGAIAPPPPPPPPARRFTIVIDPGHGGSDPGAVRGARLEKNDNLRLGLAVRNLLHAQGQNVIMTRSTDVFVTLANRSAISNQNNAGIFVSIHRNASANTAANGMENYVFTNAPVRNLLYGFNVNNALVRAGAQSNRGVLRRNFAVIRNTNAPAMLLEVGFISNARDNQLFDQNFNAYAAAIARGIMESLRGPNAPAQRYFFYTVVSGDTLARVAQRFGVTVNSISTLNLLTGTGLQVGQVLKIRT